jgi:hypothetical protein
MFSGSVPERPTTIHDLKAGDIVIFYVHGVPHAAIYSPKYGEYGDLIQMNYDKQRSGAIKSTLSKQLLQGKDVYVFRSKSKWIDGEKIAAQAESWLRQGIVFDERRLARSLYDTTGEPAKSAEHNMLQYLKYTARAATMPIKVHQYPYYYSSYMTGAALGMLFPDFSYGWPHNYLAANAVEYGTSDPNRPKGMTCVTLALLCIASAALHDEVNPVTKDTGWVSLKYSPEPKQSNLPFFQTLRKVREEVHACDFDGPGLDALFTEEQQANFNLERLREKLTPGIAALNPQQTPPEDFFSCLKSDTDNWQNLGILDKTVVKEFDKAAFDEERLDIGDDIPDNRMRFMGQFDLNIFNRNPDKPEKSYHVCRFRDRPSVRVELIDHEIERLAEEKKKLLKEKELLLAKLAESEQKKMRKV